MIVEPGRCTLQVHVSVSEHSIPYIILPDELGGRACIPGSATAKLAHSRRRREERLG
jgi:hypothetical protein